MFEVINAAYSCVFLKNLKLYVTSNNLQKNENKKVMVVRCKASEKCKSK